MNPLFLFIIFAAVMMFMLQRSAKKRSQQAQDMQTRLEPGAGVRTIGGMYALVKDVTADAVELEVAPGVFALYAKQAIAQVLDPVEYNRIVHGDEAEADEAEASDDADAVEAVEATADEAAKETVEDAPVDFGKDGKDESGEAGKLEAKVGGDKDASAK